MKIKVTETSPSNVSIEVDLGEDEETRLMEEIAVKTLVKGIKREGYDLARRHLEGSWREFINGILSGSYACHKNEDELLPMFRVLMALVGLAQDGLESVEEYRIVEEAD